MLEASPLRARGPRTLQQTADDVLRSSYEPLKADVLRGVGGKLRRQGIKTIGPDDLEDAYNQGWEGVYEHIVQGKPLILPGLLFTITYRRALDICRRSHEDRRVDLDLESYGVETDLAGQIDDRQKLRRLFSRLKDRLNEKEQAAVKLCVLRGYPRAEAADRLKVDRVAFERIMDSATKKISAVVASIEARGCGDEEWSRLMRDYALGLLAEDDRDYQRAHAHIEDDEGCESCRRYVRALQGVAAMPPVTPRLEPGVLAFLLRLFAGASRGGSETTGAGARGGALVFNGATAKIGAVLGVAAVLSFVGLQAATPAHHPEGSNEHSFAGPIPSVLTSRPLVQGFGDLNAGYGWMPRHATHPNPSRRARPKTHPAKRTKQVDTGEFSFERATPTISVTRVESPPPTVATHSARRTKEHEAPTTEFPGFEE